jgi:GntR family transcriptional regulator
MWELNRSTLRSAVAKLTGQGRLYSVQGSGTRVAPRFIRRLQDLRSFSESAVAQGMRPESRLLSFSTMECDKQLSRRFHRMLGERFYRITRLRLTDGNPVLLETAFIPEDLAPGLEQHDLAGGSLFAVLGDVYGVVPFRGQEKISITQATGEEAEHLAIAEGEPVFWIVSETFTESGELMEYCRTVARADVMDMTSTLRWQEEEA